MGNNNDKAFGIFKRKEKKDITAEEIEREQRGPKGIKFFFKLFGRNFSKLLTLNLMMLFMAIPIMLGASGLKILKFILEGATVSTFELALLFIGIVVSYIVSVIVIKFLMDFVKRHSFSVFGIYRIILGAVLIGYFLFV